MAKKRKRKPRETKGPQEISLEGRLRIISQGIDRELISTIKNVGEELSHAISNQTDREMTAFPCKGANGRRSEVTALAIIGFRGYVQIRCPRYQAGLEYIDKDGDKATGYFCYCGENPRDASVVKEEEFAEHNIFECPYAEN